MIERQHHDPRLKHRGGVDDVLARVLRRENGPELHAFAFGVAPLSVRFEDGAGTAEKSRWHYIANRLDELAQTLANPVLQLTCAAP